MKKLMIPPFLIPLFINQSQSMDYPSQWETLSKDDPISIFAPGYGGHDGSIEKARDVVSSFGFDANISEDLINPTPLGYSNTVKYRATHFIQELNNEKTKVIWALRGGRGSSEILDYLPEISLSRKPL